MTAGCQRATEPVAGLKTGAFPVTVSRAQRVGGLGSREEDRATAREVLSLAHSRQPRQVAEGLEHQAPRNFLAGDERDNLQACPCGEPIACARYAVRFSSERVAHA